MRHVFLVAVGTDDSHADAPDATSLKNELLSALEFDAYQFGILGVQVTQVSDNWNTLEPHEWEEDCD